MADRKVSELKELKGYMTRNLQLHGEIRGLRVDDQSFKAKDTGKPVTNKILIILIDDDDGERVILIDTDVSHEKDYVRGERGTFRLRLDVDCFVYGKGKILGQILVVDYQKDGCEVKDFAAGNCVEVQQKSE